MANGNKQLVLNVIGGNYDHQLKSANYLLAAHGACLVLCLSVLKDYSPTSHFRGIGVFIVLFGIGLLAAIVNYISLSLARGVALNAVMDEIEADEATTGFLLKLHLPALITSIGTLVLAVLIVMVRFASL